ncbi:unnamed protein product [Bursaphelenchus xylophilus]|uniref:(pine wood nematode) hypothetical protein n=1 Tax=Bursaphelenchus xylophilus TaxID=6326 RepID=A0A1I7SAW4_BURXY|nr:unnamed protein product [Bursaphelenchus xylophilus]CAG9106155.1 unnamed protein product [Bursaphelenchus xylophilus]
MLLFKGFKSKQELEEEKRGKVPENLKWISSKKHFRETEEWKKKKHRIIAKIRVMGKLNLNLLLSRMPVRSIDEATG